jgi:NDP-mannose synthase
MRAVILAGGKGTRLKPYTTAFPKPLMPVSGMPILEILIKQLVRDGADHITIAVGYLANLIQVYFGNGERLGVKIDYSHETTPLGTMGPLHLISNLPENFLVLNGDILTDLSFSAFFKAHCEEKSVYTISSYEREINSDFGVLETNQDRKLIGFKEKPKIKFEVSMGIYAANRSILNLIPKETPFGFDQLMLALLEKNLHPLVRKHEGKWLDIGRPDDYESAQTLAEEFID